MDDILDSLAQDIEQASFSRFFAKSEYRRNQQSAMEHTQWLEEHLDDEGRAHLDHGHLGAAGHGSDGHCPGDPSGPGPLNKTAPVPIGDKGG